MRFQKSLMTGAFALAALACAGVAPAQEKAPKPDDKIIIERSIVGQAEVVASGGPNTFVFVNSEVGFENKVVKGAPYSAEATTETVQTLSDGNRIVRKNSASIYRDGEGRTRREQTLNVIGTWTAAGDPPKTIFINDPVARVNYILDPRTQTARKMNIAQLLPPGQVSERLVAPPMGASPAPNIRVFETTAPSPERREFPKPKVEQLGKQMIEGVEAEGTRTTVTIPAGQIGNERPIDIVTEKWYSTELQVLVYSKRSDPMAGETTYKLTNINRAEPSRSLFEVPAGYTLKESPEFNMRWRAQRPSDR